MVHEGEVLFRGRDACNPRRVEAQECNHCSAEMGRDDVSGVHWLGGGTTDLCDVVLGG